MFLPARRSTKDLKDADRAGKQERRQIDKSLSSTLDSKKKKNPVYKGNIALETAMFPQKEVHSRWKQEWATQEEHGDTAQARGNKLGKPNWNLHTGLQELQNSFL